MVRKSNFELLRIISMMMIIGLHYFHSEMGGAIGQQKPNELNFYITYFLEGLFHTSVNCYILITGYFMANKKEVSISKVFNILLMMIFFGFVFFSISILMGWQTFSWLGLFKGLFPIFFGLKWFILVYIILYLLTPFINAGLTNFTKKGMMIYLIIYLFFFSIWPSFLPGAPNSDLGYGIINFVLMYSIGFYIRNHYRNDKHKKYIYLLGFFGCGLLTFFAKILVTYFDIEFINVWSYDYIFIVLGSVLLFLCFSKVNIQSNAINYIAKFTLAVYFFHVDPSILNFLYRDFLNTNEFWHSTLYLPHLLISVLITYLIGTIFGIIQNWIFNKIKVNNNNISSIFNFKISPRR